MKKSKKKEALKAIKKEADRYKMSDTLYSSIEKSYKKAKQKLSKKDCDRILGMRKSHVRIADMIKINGVKYSLGALNDMMPEDKQVIMLRRKIKENGWTILIPESFIKDETDMKIQLMYISHEIGHALSGNVHKNIFLYSIACELTYPIISLFKKDTKPDKTELIPDLISFKICNANIDDIAKYYNSLDEIVPKYDTTCKKRLAKRRNDMADILSDKDE